MNCLEASSTAQASQLSADGQTLTVHCDHRLDNTRQPNAADFSVQANGRSLRLRNAWLQSPVPGQPGIAAIHLVLRDPLPVAAELRIAYQPSLRGLRSMVDNAPLAAFELRAWLDVSGRLRPADAVPELPAPAPPQSDVVHVEETAVDPSALDREQRLLQRYLDSMLGQRDRVVPPKPASPPAPKDEAEEPVAKGVWPTAERQLWLLEPVSDLKH